MISIIKKILAKILEVVEDRIFFPLQNLYTDICVRIRYYVFYEKHDVIYLNKGPGWIDKDEVLLECVFKVLEDFVEDECAYMYQLTESDRPWYKKIRLLSPFYKKRSSEDGIAFLNRYSDWLETGEYGFPDDEEMTKKEKVFLQSWAEWADELIEVYKWWKFDRPKRIDEFELYKDIEDSSKIFELQAKRRDEDLEKMKKVIDLSPGMWT